MPFNAPHPGPRAAASSSPVAPAATSEALDEVIDLPGNADGTASLVEAVMRHSMTELVEVPVRPPTCPEARLAIARDRRLVLVALAGHGLAGLRAIGQAFRWVAENRALLAMALPQFNLDAHAMPTLRLLVDEADVSAEALGPVFQSPTCSVHTYRRIKWGQRLGLLLNAA